MTQTTPRTLWQLQDCAPPEELINLMTTLEIPPLLASVMWARGFQEDATTMLEPPLDLTAIPELATVAMRLEASIKEKKRILIHGDYDADGITGTAILTLGLRALGGNVTPFIPHRINDGYGISPDRVPEHIANCDLFITVDCGITNLAEISALQAAGIEVIVSDHHHPGQKLPDCLTVHPTLSPYAQKGLPELTGAGVAYHILWALHNRLELPPPIEYSDLATIGTIADVAPLMGENRALILAGLAQLKDSMWTGVRALVKQVGLEQQNSISATDVAFIIAPRLNAAGRMGEADLGLELLITASSRRAQELAVYLHARNDERKQVQQNMLDEAIKQVDPDAPAIVVASEGWHAGVMGIVASKLLETYYKPVFIIAKAQGSVRSPVGISAVAALTNAQHTLARYGGHSQAAGFTLPSSQKKDIEAFKQAIYEYVAQQPKPQKIVTLDALITQADMTPDMLAAVEKLEPYGQGHRPPNFGYVEMLEYAKAVGKAQNHLQMRVGGIKGISWQNANKLDTLTIGNEVVVAASLQENTWQGQTNIEFMAEDVAPALPLKLSKPLNSSQDVANWLVPLRQTTNKRPTKSITWQQDQTLDEFWTQVAKDCSDIWLETVIFPEDSPEKTLTTHPLRTLLARCAKNTSKLTLHIHLNQEQQLHLNKLAQNYPTLSDVRGAFLHIRKGTWQNAHLRHPNHRKICEQILQELELIDTHGRAKKGAKRNPYTSATLQAGLLEHYRLSSFLKAYQHTDNATFAHIFKRLFINSQL